MTGSAPRREYEIPWFPYSARLPLQSQTAPSLSATPPERSFSPSCTPRRRDEIKRDAIFCNRSRRILPPPAPAKGTFLNLNSGNPFHMVKGKAGGGFTGRRLKAQWEGVGVDPEAIFLRRVNKPPSCERRPRPSNVGFRSAHRGGWVDFLTFDVGHRCPGANR